METAECGQCSTKWYICTLCTSLRVHIRGLSNLRAHYRSCHKEDRRPPKKKGCLHATLPRIESVLGPSVSGPSVKSLDPILEYGIVPPSPHPPFPTSPVLLTQVSDTTTIRQPSRTAGEVPPCTTPPPCPPTLPTVQSLPITEESLKFDNNQSRKYFEQNFIRLTVAVVSLSHCVQGPAESRSVGHRSNTKRKGTKTLVDYCVLVPKKLPT
jgi:hypothetical protein